MAVADYKGSDAQIIHEPAQPASGDVPVAYYAGVKIPFVSFIREPLGISQGIEVKGFACVFIRQAYGMAHHDPFAAESCVRKPFPPFNKFFI